MSRRSTLWFAAPLFAASVSSAAPLVTPEFSLEAPVLSAASRAQREVAVAWGDGQYLAVWTDERRGLNALDIYGARLAADGSVIDKSGFVIASGATTAVRSFTPAVAWNGQHFLVVWNSRTTSGATRIVGNRIDAAGVPLDGTGFLIASAGGVPSVASNGDGFLVVWADHRDGVQSDIYAARVNNAGAVLDETGIRLTTASTNENLPSVASDGSNYLVAWTEAMGGADPNVRAVRVGSNGSVLDEAAIPVTTAPGTQHYPAAAFNGTSFQIVFVDIGADLTTRLMGARVSTAGGLLDAEATPLASGNTAFGRPGIGAREDQLLVSWSQPGTGGRTNVAALRIDDSGTSLDASPLVPSPISRNQSLPAIASDGTGFLLLWHVDNSGSDEDITGTRVSATSELLDSPLLLVSTVANVQTRPRIARGDGSSLVVWRDGSAVRAARIGPEDAVLDAPSLLVAASATGTPVVAADGAGFLVVWAEARAGTGHDLIGQRLAEDGSLLGTSFVISDAAGDQLDPAVASGGGYQFVAWRDLRAATGNADLYGARVLDGTLVDETGLVLSAGDGEKLNPAVGFDGTRFLVGWKDTRTGGTSGVYATRVGVNGTVHEPEGFLVAATTTPRPTVAVSGHDGAFLVSWASGPTVGTENLWASRVSGAGAVLDSPPISVSAAPALQHTPAIAHDGTTFVVAWADTRSGHQALRAARVDAEGEVLDPDSVLLSGLAATENPDLAAAEGGGLHVVYARPVREESANRIRGRYVHFALAAPVATPQEVHLEEDQSATITLAGTDADGDTLTYAVVSPPAHGTLNGTPPSLTYTPASNFHGTDSFTFNVEDGRAISQEATVTLQISPVNDAPIAVDGDAAGSEDTQVSVNLQASDPDGDALVFEVVTQPSHGALSGSPLALSYAPSANFHGTDAFTFRVTDGTLESNVATVTLTIAAVNDPPVAEAISVATTGTEPVATALVASDADGDSLTYRITVQPSGGTLSGQPPSVTYIANEGFSGEDTFRFVANDGTVDSAPAVVTVTVAAGDDPADPGCGCGTGGGANFALGALLLFLLSAPARPRAQRGARG